MKHILAALLLMPTLALAQWAPSKPVHALIGFAPGSGNEISFRKASDIVMKQNPGVTFTVETKPGADASVASNQFMSAPSDGLHVMIPSHMSLFVTNDIWQKNTKRFEYNSFKPAVTLGKSPLVLVASSRSNVNTPQEFVKYITNGKPVNVAVGGGAHRMAFEYIVMKTGANPDLIKDIRFQGPLPAVTSVAQYDGKTGTEFGIMPIAIARPLIDAGKVKLVGLTGSKVPEKIAGAKLLEESVPGISVYAGWMVSLPPGTAKEILDWYQREFSRAIKSKEYQDWARDSYILSPEDQLTTEGVKKYAAALRKNFAPIIAELSKPKQNK